MSVEIPNFLDEKEMDQRGYSDNARETVLELQEIIKSLKTDLDKITDQSIKDVGTIKKLNDDIIYLKIEKDAAEKIQMRASNNAFELKRKNYWYQRRFGEPPDRKSFKMNFIQKIAVKIFRI